MRGYIPLTTNRHTQCIQRSEFLLPYVGSSSHYWDRRHPLCRVLRDFPRAKSQALGKDKVCWVSPSAKAYTWQYSYPVCRESNTRHKTHSTRQKMLWRVSNFWQTKVLGKRVFVSSRHQLKTVNYAEWHKEALDKRSAFAKFHLQTLIVKCLFLTLGKVSLIIFFIFCPSPKLFLLCFYIIWTYIWNLAHFSKCLIYLLNLVHLIEFIW
jgi:hypothetical protein